MIGRLRQRLGRSGGPGGDPPPRGAAPTRETGDGGGASESGGSATGPVRLCGSADLAAGEARCFDVGGRRIALARIDDDFFAIDDTCSHADYSLSEGDVDVDECALECPAHGSLFDLRTGDALTLPAVAPVSVHEVAVSEEGVFVTLRGTGR